MLGLRGGRGRQLCARALVWMRLYGNDRAYRACVCMSSRRRSLPRRMRIDIAKPALEQILTQPALRCRETALLPARVQQSHQHRAAVFTSKAVSAAGPMSHVRTSVLPGFASYQPLCADDAPRDSLPRVEGIGFLLMWEDKLGCDAEHGYGLALSSSLGVSHRQRLRISCRLHLPPTRPKYAVAGMVQSG